MNEAYKWGQAQVEFQCLTAGLKHLTTKELTSELLRITARDNISYEGFVYLEKKLITDKAK